MEGMLWRSSKEAIQVMPNQTNGLEKMQIQMSRKLVPCSSIDFLTHFFAIWCAQHWLSQAPQTQHNEQTTWARCSKIERLLSTNYLAE